MKTILATFARTSLSTRIITGLMLGVFTGLFFGEPAAALQPVADIYIRLMQMTVLPYLVMSLIIGFGQLETEAAKRLAVRGGTAAGRVGADVSGYRGNARRFPHHAERLVLQ